MELCSDGHSEVCFEAFECPACLAYDRGMSKGYEDGRTEGYDEGYAEAGE